MPNNSQNAALRVLGLILLLSVAVSLLRAEVAVTIYNQDLGLVRETRKFDFDKGVSEIRFVDVASQLIPSSVHFTAPGVALLEQNYQYDLVDAAKLAARYLDNEIELTAEGGDFFKGTLLSVVGSFILREKDGSVRTIGLGQVRSVHFPSLPEGLITRPTLVWKVNVEKGGKAPGEISYLTNGMTWAAEYVAVVNKDDNALDLTGWTNITNNSGATFEEARIKLMAGDVQILRDDRRREKYAMRAMVADAEMSAGGFEEQPFYEYHLYTLQRPSTLKNNEQKQISLFPNAAVGKVDKEYWYKSYGDAKKVRVYLSFVNHEDNHLGIPLPAGKVRVYKEGLDGGLEFVGEDKIDHTPRQEKVKISTGYAFDVVVERKQTDYQRKGNATETEYEITLRNRKAEKITVTLSERVWGDWTMVSATEGWEKKSAQDVEWKVELKPDEEKKVTYRLLNK